MIQVGDDISLSLESMPSLGGGRQTWRQNLQGDRDMAGFVNHPANQNPAAPRQLLGGLVQQKTQAHILGDAMWACALIHTLNR
jgi:hypothetical protein